VISAASATAPVTFDTIGVLGGCHDRPATTEANSSSIGSINREWNA
jgi:hypothetical protein